MAIYLPESNALFLHIPKTGGTWVEEALKRGGVAHHEEHPCAPMVTPRHGALRHFHLYKYKHIFTFVRHPIAWYESWYKFNKGTWNRWAEGWHPQDTILNCGSDDFNQFIRNVLDIRKGYVTDMYLQYTKNYGHCEMHIGRTRSLVHDLLRILNEIKQPHNEEGILHTKACNVSSGYEIAWDPSLLAEMRTAETYGTEFYNLLEW